MAESLANIAIEKKAIEADLLVLEKYQTFSSELLRISLLGLGLFGFVVKEGFNHLHDQAIAPPAIRWLSFCSTFAFAIAAAAALCHRYLSSDALACLVYYLRIFEAKREAADQAQAVKRYRRQLKCSTSCLVISALSLGIAAALVAAIIAIWLFI